MRTSENSPSTHLGELGQGEGPRLSSLGPSMECSIFAGSLAGAASGGIVLYLYLLAPYVLLDDLGAFDHVLADADLFLGHRALANDDLFFGHRHDHLVSTRP